MATPVLLIVAGPNGSGKTTLTRALRARGVDIPNYLNADDFAQNLSGSDDERAARAQKWVSDERARLIDAGAPVSYETVMSHPSHLDAAREARRHGYEVHIYFIGTENAAINIDRVADRVAKGEHDVPRARIIGRYFRVMRETLPAILAVATYAEFYDNSGDKPFAAAKLRDGSLELLTDDIPEWVRRYLLPHVGSGTAIPLIHYRHP